MVRKFDRELKLEAMRMASEEGSTAVEVDAQHVGKANAGEQSPDFGYDA